MTIPQPPTTGIAHATGIANSQHAAHSHDRYRSAENMAELKAMRGSRFAFLRRLINRLSRRGG
ncbi:hypothetical protein [Jatrophihabitans sp.]|uniref:hypothetical protein n=1 Tax=Jatrophihabitans sp. TaxID=1932789 RepID=UPI002F190452